MADQRIKVLLFARARDLAGGDQVSLVVPVPATVARVRRRLAEECPALAGLLERSALAVGDEFAEDDVVVPQGADVALLPPVSGGGEGEIR